jgi:serine/threonine protein kinase
MTTGHTMSDDELIDSLLDRWEEACDRGDLLSPESLAADRPDLMPELAQRIKSLLAGRSLEQILGGGREGSGREPGPPWLIRGRYQLEQLLGRGSEGAVWLARDMLIGREVAVKLPLLDCDALLEEARLVASLRHPNILKVLDAGHDDNGKAFVVTELMRGRTLADRIRDRESCRVPVSQSLAWIRQIAGALHAVHLAGRAHRDVKSINILLDENDDAVLADFGIAVPVASQTPGSSLGTPAYKSPEQVAGKPLDARSDVYSLGLVAHEILTGRLPFTNLDDPAAIEREIKAGVDQLVSRGIPARLRPVIRKAVATRPADRHESAPQFARELEQAWRGSVVRRWGAATALGMVALILLLGWRLREEKRRSDEAVSRQTEEAMKELGAGMRIHDESQRKVQDVIGLGRKLIEETRKNSRRREGE